MAYEATPVLLKNLPVYRAASSAFGPGATPQDVFTITGSASKIIRVTRMGLSTIQNTAGVNTWFIRKRSTENSGGTSAAVTAVPSDSSMPAATATILQYTAQPTIGNLVGSVWGGRIDSPAAATTGTGIAGGIEVDFVLMHGSTITLRGTGEVLTWDFNDAALPTGMTCCCWVEWQEE